MIRKEFNIIKPQYYNDIYNRIKRIPEIEEEFNLNRLLEYEPETDKKVFLFIDIKKKWVFSYYTNKSEVDMNDKVERYCFDNNKELLDYLIGLKKEFEKKDLWISELKERIKELKLYIDSKKPNNIKELKKGKTSINLNTKLYTSWGYDQTNVEMFRIIKFIGKNYFIIQEIGQKSSDHYPHGMACNVKAGDFDLDKLPIKAFISPDGYMSICEKGYKRGLYVDTGEKHYKSWYA
jgi:hypothetical protein